MSLLSWQVVKDTSSLLYDFGYHIWKWFWVLIWNVSYITFSSTYCYRWPMELPACQILKNYYVVCVLFQDNLCQHLIGLFVFCHRQKLTCMTCYIHQIEMFCSFIRKGNLCCPVLCCCILLVLCLWNLSCCHLEYWLLNLSFYHAGKGNSGNGKLKLAGGTQTENDDYF